MHVNAKKLAFSGLALALCVIAIVLSGIIEFNTLFLLGLASFLIGIIIRECGMGLGFGFYLGAILLGVILAPNKLYCITFGAMGLYVVAIEFFWRHLGRIHTKMNRRVLFWVIKYIVFNVIYLPMLLLFPKLLFAGEVSSTFLIIAAAGGQIVIFIYDRAYEYFQGHVWTKFRKRIGFEL